MGEEIIMWPITLEGFLGPARGTKLDQYEFYCHHWPLSRGATSHSLMPNVLDGRDGLPAAWSDYLNWAARNSKRG